MSESPRSVARGFLLTDLAARAYLVRRMGDFDSILATRVPGLNPRKSYPVPASAGRSPFDQVGNSNKAETGDFGRQALVRFVA